MIRDGVALEKAGRVIAIEKDAAFVEWLRESLATPNFELIHADAMDVNLPQLLGRGVTKLVANLPYAISSRILVDLFEQPAGPRKYVVTVQLEVGERLAAKPGSSDFGVLSILAQLEHDIRVLKVVSPGCFFPPPQVKSAIVSIVRRPPPVPVRDASQLKSLVKYAFSRRRKQLGTILHGFRPGAVEALTAIGIEPRERPENIPLEGWIALSNRIA